MRCIFSPEIDIVKTLCFLAVSYIGDSMTKSEKGPTLTDFTKYSFKHENSVTDVTVQIWRLSPIYTSAKLTHVPPSSHQNKQNKKLPH